MRGCYSFYGFEWSFPGVRFHFWVPRPWHRPWRVQREEYLRWLEEYKKELQEELAEVEKEIEEWKKPLG